MMFAGLMALAGAAVVDHARSARRQTKGSAPGLHTRPCSWDRGGGGEVLEEGGGGGLDWKCAVSGPYS